MQSIISSSSTKGLLYISCLLIIVFQSCKPSNEVVSINGKHLKDIKSNVITTDEGDVLTLQEDSIAKIFYLVRHAEKDTVNKVDPLLSPEGNVRATKIADIMRGTRIDAIYSTMKLRSLYTVDSLADIKAMSVLPYDNQGLKNLLLDIKDSENFNRIFVVGHSNTIPSITNSLAGKPIFNKAFEEDEYDNFVIVVENKSGTTETYVLKY